jgi:hypothetical protein|tara:strand:- start:1319 stop:3526 length:2208 start_codon:yes stop_codon:yes gene_type:complete
MADLDPIQDHKPEPAFVTWSSDAEKANALEASSSAVEAYDGIMMSTASHRSFLDIEPNRSVRSDFGRDDYYRFRRDEAIPRKQKDIMSMCMNAYDKVGIIKNVIDLMGDFSCQGVSLVHPNKKIEKFYKRWFEKVNGVERSERFLNTLYRCGNVVIKRRTARINKATEDRFKKISASPDMVMEDIRVLKREVPWQYDLLNPLSVDAIGGELGIFAGQTKYKLKISDLIKNLATKSNDPEHKHIMKNLPPDLANAIRKGEKYIPLDSEKTSVFFYKKDDWLVWAKPMIYAILDDIVMLEKMKLADMAALDGAISNIRLWKLGDLDNKILPTKTAINKLRNILAGNVGGGTMDLVWGPELDFKESNSQVFKFLGSQKYEPVLNSIYAGLGIPPTLTGLAGNGGGFTNNFISLKTLVERLEYGRNVLLGFWNKEIEIVQKAMGFRFPARVHFDQMVLSDEAAEKNLLVQLADRDIISSETLQERFGEIPDIEKIRINREHKTRENQKIPQKAGPYHNPQHRNDLEKIALTKDTIAPHELGLVPSDETGDNPLTIPKNRPKFDKVEQERKEKEDRDSQMPQVQQKQREPVGRPEDGRPKNSKDQGPRKQKVVKPRTSANYDFVNLLLWACDAQKKISEIVNPALLSYYKKKNMRGLTKSETSELEYIKMAILSNLRPDTDITADVVYNALENNLPPDINVIRTLSSLNESFSLDNDRSPNIDEMRNIHASACAVSLMDV